MNLTDEEIRNKVAEACGEETVFNLHPNYPLDLNACAEFEATLNEGEMVAMSQYLHRELGVLWGFATSRQRCIAFLKTKGIIP